MRAFLVGLLLACCCVCGVNRAQAADDLTEEKVLETIQTAKKSLLAKQRADGSWDCQIPNLQGLETGGTALVTLALLNAGMTAEDKEIKLALKFLRESDDPKATYASSLVLMVLSLVKDPRDKLKMTRLVSHLENGQVTRGEMAGTWGYSSGGLVELGSGDRSNGQFAILGLYEAAHAGIPVKREVWQRARDHWLRVQVGDGGWNYSGGGEQGGSTGSMTVAGIASLVMTSAMLQDDKDVDAQGRPNCCGEPEEDKPMRRALAWLKNHFSVGTNPGGGSWLFYYLYGLERAGRLSGQRFFGENDWYRLGARFLITGMDKRLGMWTASNNENDSVVNTSLALLFLSKGLAPVLINKLQYESETADAWNRHQFEIRNLTDRISGADRWPKLVTWQVVDMKLVVKNGSVADLRQAPVLYFTGSSAPKFNDQEVELLKQFINLGGFVLAVNSCESAGFKEGCFELVRKMYPKGETALEKLKADHPIYRSEFRLDGSGVELWGADLGCRTAFVYSPEDLGCFWSKWSRADPPNRPQALRTRVERAMRVGMNIVAYATGREPPSKLRQLELASEEGQADNVKRGLLQVAQLRHTGGWDTAPKSARNLLLALNRTAGLTASTTPGAITASDSSLFNYQLLVMHGRHRFSIPDAEVDRLRTYLARGNLLFADACCGATQFDASFREFAERLYPDHKLSRIPPSHELFSNRIGHELKSVRRRAPEVQGSNQTLEANIIEGEPFLEGIEVDGRYVVIYSKHDISCALERQATLGCAGYMPEDATRIAVNVVQYSLLQELK